VTARRARARRPHASALLFALVATTIGAGAVLAQDAGPLSAGEAAEADAEQTERAPDSHAAESSEAREPVAVTYHDQPAPLSFRIPAGGKSPEVRAHEASGALKSALDRRRDEAPPPPSVDVDGDVATVRVAGEVITTLSQEDARAEGMNLETYAAQLEGRLEGFVPAQLQRRTLQIFFFHLFLSVLFGVLGFVTLRMLRTTFDRWDHELDERRGSLRAISILRVPIFSGDMLGGALAFGLATGRVLAYIAAVIATLSAVLSQFEATRPAKRITWKRVPPERVPAFRLSARVLVVVLAAPLLIAEVFGQFGTPLETLALAGGIALIVATLPILTTYVVGVFMLWRGTVKAGDWVQIGDVSGEVTSCSFQEISLVPEGGGTITVPMLFLVLRPLRRLRQPPEVRLDVEVLKDRPAQEIVEVVTAAVRAVEADARVELRAVSADRLTVRLAAPSVRGGVREQLLLALSEAADREELTLPRNDGPA